MVQKIQRGLVTRRKFHRLKKCLELIIRIQSNFRKKFFFVTLKTILIQKTFRKHLAEKKYERKKKRKEESLINPFCEYYDSSDEEEVKRVLINKKKREREREKQRKNSIRIEKEKKKRQSEEEKFLKEKENRKKRLSEKEQRLSLNTKDKMKDDKNKANMFYSYFSDLEGENKDKTETTNNKKRYIIFLRKKVQKKKIIMISKMKKT